MAGAIRTSPQNAAYDEGWERAFGDHPDKGVRDAAWHELNRRFTEWAGHPPRAHDGAGDREPRVSDPEGSTEPEAEQAASREREVAGHAPSPYSCPRCGWHLAYTSEKCGNATCPRGRSTYVTRS